MPLKNTVSAPRRRGLPADCGELRYLEHPCPVGEATDLESEKNEWGAQMSRAKAGSGEFERAKRRAESAHNAVRDTTMNFAAGTHPELGPSSRASVLLKQTAPLIMTVPRMLQKMT
jgi:hypothetical protein